MRDRATGVDKQRACLPDTQLGNVVAHSQSCMPAKEAVKAGCAERRHLGKHRNADRLAVIGMDMVEYALDARLIGRGHLPAVAAAPAIEVQSLSADNNVNTSIKRASRLAGGAFGISSISGRALRAASVEKAMPRPALASIGAIGRISANASMTDALHLSVNHMTSATCGRESESRSAEHHVCGRFGPSSTRSPCS